MLPNDDCRCHDDGCPERDGCRRYTERSTGRVHCGSLFPFDEPLLSPCPLKIPLGNKPEECCPSGGTECTT